jgi:hypothetical protein
MRSMNVWDVQDREEVFGPDMTEDDNLYTLRLAAMPPQLRRRYDRTNHSVAAFVNLTGARLLQFRDGEVINTKTGKRI